MNDSLHPCTDLRTVRVEQEFHEQFLLSGRHGKGLSASRTIGAKSEIWPKVIDESMRFAETHGGFGRLDRPPAVPGSSLSVYDPLAVPLPVGAS